MKRSDELAARLLDSMLLEDEAVLDSPEKTPGAPRAALSMLVSGMGLLTDYYDLTIVNLVRDSINVRAQPRTLCNYASAFPWLTQ